MSLQKEKSLGNKVVLAKIPREEFSRFQQYCDHNGESINACMKRLILAEIDNPQPSKIAGKSIFTYNKRKDNFAWKVLLDDDNVISLDDNLPANSVEQLLESIMNVIDERTSQLKKKTVDSVSIPTKLMRSKK